MIQWLLLGNLVFIYIQYSLINLLHIITVICFHLNEGMWHKLNMIGGWIKENWKNKKKKKSYNNRLLRKQNRKELKRKLKNKENKNHNNNKMKDRHIIQMKIKMCL